MDVHTASGQGFRSPGLLDLRTKTTSVVRRTMCARPAGLSSASTIIPVRDAACHSRNTERNGWRTAVDGGLNAFAHRRVDGTVPSSSERQGCLGSSRDL